MRIIMEGFSTNMELNKSFEYFPFSTHVDKPGVICVYVYVFCISFWINNSTKNIKSHCSLFYKIENTVQYYTRLH